MYMTKIELAYSAVERAIRATVAADHALEKLEITQDDELRYNGTDEAIRILRSVRDDMRAVLEEERNGR